MVTRETEEKVTFFNLIFGYWIRLSEEFVVQNRFMIAP